MSEINITKEELYSQYIVKINHILDECDWITHFPSEQVCVIICEIINETSETPINPEELHIKYMDYVDSLNISTVEWVEKYSIKDIIEMIHDLIFS